jgi:hypothetical protein
MCCSGLQIFLNSRIRLEILGCRRVIQRKFLSEDPHTSDATVQNLVVRDCCIRDVLVIKGMSLSWRVFVISRENSPPSRYRVCRFLGYVYLVRFVLGGVLRSAFRDGGTDSYCLHHFGVLTVVY